MKKNLKILLLFTLALPLLFSLISSTTPTLAAGPHQRTIIRGSGSGALAFWPVTVGQFSNIEVHAFKTSAGNDIIFFADGCGPFPCFGELTTTANVFQINPGLSSATLSPVTLSVCLAFDEFFNCIQEVPVTVQATWTGFGPAFTSNSVSRFGHGQEIFSDVFAQRQATATGSLDGQQLGQSSNALLIKFRSVQLFSNP
jgi:hypothetical protein